MGGERGLTYSAGVRMRVPLYSLRERGGVSSYEEVGGGEQCAFQEHVIFRVAADFHSSFEVDPDGSGQD